MRRFRFGLALRARMDGERKLDLLTEAAEDRHEPVDGEAREIDVADADELAVRDPGAGFGLPGAQLLGIEHLNDLRRQQRLGLAHVGVRIVEIAEDVAAAAHDFHVIAGHCSISFRRRSRAWIKSISCFGVLIPVFDFFWKAWITHTSAPSCMTYTTRNASPRNASASSSTPEPKPLSGLAIVG